MQTNGRIRHGLAQSFALWVAAFAAIALVRDVTFAWTMFLAGLVAVLLLGNLHRRRHRADSAVGAYTGAALWPLLAGAIVIAVNIASMATSPYE